MSTILLTFQRRCTSSAIEDIILGQSKYIFRQVFGKAIVEGCMNVHDEHLGFVPVEIVGAPGEAQSFLDSGDFEGLMNYLKQQRESQKTDKKSKEKK